MSYTTLDWLGDLAGSDESPGPNRPHRSCVRTITEAAREDGRMIVRISDMRALVAFAEREGLDRNDDAQWADTDDEVQQDALMALVNWAKEQRDWEPF